MNGVNAQKLDTDDERNIHHRSDDMLKVGTHIMCTIKS